jgi:hypothetical protein
MQVAAHQPLEVLRHSTTGFAHLCLQYLNDFA